MMTITFPLNLKEISILLEAKRNLFFFVFFVLILLILLIFWSDAKKPKTNNPRRPEGKPAKRL